MRNLRSSGERSFEELIARLLSGVSGERIRRCSAGSQGGVDAIADVPFAIENKRYKEKLKTRDLVGGLAEAASHHPDLELWVLAATCAVGAQTSKALDDAGSRLGIAVLILDTTASEPNLPGVGGITALAATDVAATIAALADATWRESMRSKPDLTTIESELNEIGRMSEFAAWKEHLRCELRDLPTWRRLVRSQNQRLLSFIRSDAGNAFGTPYDVSKAVSRTVEGELTQWAQSSLRSQAVEVAVVTGERYDGKTTLVYRWLTDHLPTLPIPVFFFSSRAVQSAQGDLEGLLLHEAQAALGAFEDRASALIKRHRSRKDPGAWCVVILDGANEYVTDPRSRSAAVLWALPPVTREVANTQPAMEDVLPAERHCALLVTCRTHDYEEDSRWLGGSPRRLVKLEPYDDREFSDALALRNRTPADVTNLPHTAATMIRHPRYLDLMLSHSEELGQFPAITADVLHYLDASDKVLSSARLNPVAFKALLQGLAETWKGQRRLTFTTLRNRVSEVTDGVDASVAGLLSEGVLIQQPDGSYVPDSERLALGMGLFIRESLLPLSEHAQGERLEEILAPHANDDEKVRWLRGAVTTSLMVGDSDNHKETLDRLVAAWLSSRNFSQDDLEDVKSLSPLLIDSILRIISADSVESTVMLLAEAMIDGETPRNEKVIAEAIRRWFRMVPTDSFFHEDERKEAEAARVALAASESSLLVLDLRVTPSDAGRSVRRRHHLGLRLACAHRSIAEPLDLLALVAARGVTHWRLSNGERYAIRLLLATVTCSWFENEVTSWEAKPDTYRAAFLHELLRYSERADLAALQSRLPPWETVGFPRSISRAELRMLNDQQDNKEILQTARRAAGLAIDPDCQPPPRAWRVKLANAAIERFGDSPKLHAGRSTTRDDLDLEDLEPAVAAWASSAGASIVRAFLSDIPRRIAGGEESWSWALEGNAALLTRSDRRQLLDIIRVTPAKESGFQHALRLAYVCVMAAAPSRSLRLLLDHPFDEFEWTKFYEVLAAGDDALRLRTAEVVRTEHDPRRLKRARLLLPYLGGWEASLADLARLVSDLSDTDSARQDDYAARTLLRYSRIDPATPVSALGPLVRVTDSLFEEAWQYEAFLHTKRNPGYHGAEWLARARSASLTARHKGAAGDDDVAVAQGIERLAARIEERLNHPSFGHSEQLPEGIANEISGSAFEGWVDRLLALSRGHWRAAAGVMIPALRRALKTGHPAAKELWALAYPFERGRSGLNERITVSGLDWTLVDIHDPAVDDGLAREILRELIVDCRSDSELISVAMGARFESTARLTAVVEDLLDNCDEAGRARARFIVGWLPENASLRQRLTAADPSHWVTRIGQQAIQRLDRERRCREWLRRFLRQSRAPRRWADGRLFLACSDAATPFWVDDVIRDSHEPASRRAEATLLVGRIRKKVDDNELRDSFLGYSVRELSEVVPPWCKTTRWEDIDTTSPRGHM